MKGMDLLLSVRLQGFKPELPGTVWLDQNRPRWPIYGDVPMICDVCVLPSEDIAALDLRPLTGLVVEVIAQASSERLKALLKAIRRVSPKGILGGVPAENLLFAWSENHGWEAQHVEG
jgi:hypothetical protein